MPQVNKDQLAFEVISNRLSQIGWDGMIEYDERWGWLILAGKNQASFGYVLRRIKPYLIPNSDTSLEKALATQRKLKRDLVEVLPYRKVYGDRINAPTLIGCMKMLVKEDAEFFEKGRKSFENS